MGNSGTFSGTSADVFFTGIAIIAAGLGIYGLLLMGSLVRSSGNEPHGQQIDKLMMGLMNILVSVICIYIIVIITQGDTSDLFIQTDKLLGQLK